MVLAACASAPPPAPVIVPTEPPLASIIRLEDQRLLRDPAPPAPRRRPNRPARRGRAAAVPPPVPDLTVLLNDASAGPTARRAGDRACRAWPTAWRRCSGDWRATPRSKSVRCRRSHWGCWPARSHHAAARRPGRRLAAGPRPRGRSAGAHRRHRRRGGHWRDGGRVREGRRPGDRRRRRKRLPADPRNRSDAAGRVRAGPAEGLRAAGGRGARRRRHAGDAMVAGGLRASAAWATRGRRPCCAHSRRAMASTRGRLPRAGSARSRIAAPSTCSARLAANTPSSPIVGVEAIRGSGRDRRPASAGDAGPTC